MFALSMYEEYLNDILNGMRNCDVRLYYTEIRGKIALIKSRTNFIYGFAELISVEKISYKEYLIWHIGNQIDKNYVDFIMKNNQNYADKIAYKYVFGKIFICENPIKIKKTRKKALLFVYFDDNNNYKFEQLKLF